MLLIKFGKIFFQKSINNSIPCIQQACDDTPHWRNSAGTSCTYYAEAICQNGKAIAGKEGLLGRNYNYPENNCCSCRSQG